MSTPNQVRLAKSLPPRLLRFFERFPPPALVQNAPVPPSTTLDTPVAPMTSPADPNAAATDSAAPAPAEFTSVTQELPYHNPFQPRKNFVTGKWHGPVYGLRKQADLVKLAQQHGVLDLLPYTIKKPGEKEKRRIERGLQVKGTGVDQKVKGKLWERTLKGRLEARKQAMLDMPALIQEWKQKGHGRGWKKWPSGKAKK
ncbi:hypothetical protein BS50DRAFT_575410 [Corynespora cassiicola Philippines]|uniref:Large ribosomal subunit protein mL59 domain-containing protein n=1 Tax=Corynespora cassiicola Philippines TaxID=1448308 RepID=A0A2T2NIX8_CORCC|nr:hypothetical protein BS50DRAFT_575410 [Corynespora cassiicola Philippines]